MTAAVGSLPTRALMLTLVILSGGCGGGSDGPGIVNAPAVLSVTVTGAGANPIDVGQTVQLTAVVTVQNGASQAVSWSSNAPNIASVNSSGLVIGVGAGQATITATAVQNNARTGSVTVSVNPPQIVGVTLNSGARTIRPGDSFNLVATVDAQGTLARTVTFTSSAPTIASVTSTDGLTAAVQGVTSSATPATITARSTVDNTKFATVQVTVAGIVRITGSTPSHVVQRIGAQTKITPTLQADPGVSTAVTFASNNTAIATVSGDGTVTGVAVGQTGVVVTAVADPTQRLTVPVTIVGGVTSVSLTPDRDTLRPTEVGQLALNVVTEPGVSSAVSISSTNLNVASVDVNLRVTAVGVGQAYIRALSLVDSGVGDSTLVIVVDPCTFLTPMPIGVVVNGAVSAASCNGTEEFFSYTANVQTALTLSITHQFPVSFLFFGDRSGSYFFTNATAPGSGTANAVVAPGAYFASVRATNSANRGTFSVLAAVNANFATLCSTAATTGITVAATLNVCNFQPANRPIGVYRSYSMALLPYIRDGERVTITVTANGFTPLIEARHGSFPPITAVANPGENVAIQSFLGQGAGGFTSFTVSSANPGQAGSFTVKVEGPPSLGAINLDPAWWDADRPLGSPLPSAVRYGPRK